MDVTPDHQRFIASNERKGISRITSMVVINSFDESE